jgi:transposase
MRAFTFRPDVLAEIRYDRYHHPHPRVQRKMEVLWLKSRGLTHANIAELADVSPRSVQRYLDEFEQGGLGRVRRLNWPGKACALDEHQPSLEDYFIEHPPRSAREAQEAIERLTGIRRGLSQVRAFLKKKLGWAGGRSARSPRKRTPTSRRAT